jgi:hypothetical protein
MVGEKNAIGTKGKGRAEGHGQRRYVVVHIATDRPNS